METSNTTYQEQNERNYPPAPPSILPQNPQQAMQEMMETIDALRSIYVEENDALEAVDTEKFMSLQEKKINAARDYQNSVEQIIHRKDEFQNTSPSLHEKLQKMQAEFTEITGKNLKNLDRMQKGLRRLNDRVMHAARRAVQSESVNYGATGNINKNERSVSIGVNESA